MLQQGGADQAIYLQRGVVGGQVGLRDGHLFGYPGEVGEVAIPSEWCSKSPARWARCAGVPTTWITGRYSA